MTPDGKGAAPVTYNRRSAHFRKGRRIAPPLNPAQPNPVDGECYSQEGEKDVKPGDSLSKIAKLVYGDSSDYMRIFEANKDRLNDPNKIKIGQELVIPASR